MATMHETDPNYPRPTDTPPMTNNHEAMTLEQVRDVLRGFSVTAETSARQDSLLAMADAIDAHLSRAAEPVYQVQGLGDNTAWTDVTDFKGIENTKYSKRILYTHPPEPARDAITDDMVDRLAMHLASLENDDIHGLIWEGSPPQPWGEVWQRYESNARAALQAAMAQESGDG